MKVEIEEVIKTLIELIKKTDSGDQALKFTQAALNLAHVAQVWRQVKQAS
jgi:hypothetical protein